MQRFYDGSYIARIACYAQCMIFLSRFLFFNYFSFQIICWCSHGNNDLFHHLLRFLFLARVRQEKPINYGLYPHKILQKKNEILMSYYLFFEISFANYFRSLGNAAKNFSGI